MVLPETPVVLQEDRNTIERSNIVQDTVQNAAVVYVMPTWCHCCRYIVIAAGSSGLGVSPKATA